MVLYLCFLHNNIDIYTHTHTQKKKKKRPLSFFVNLGTDFDIAAML